MSRVGAVVILLVLLITVLVVSLHASPAKFLAVGGALLILPVFFPRWELLLGAFLVSSFAVDNPIIARLGAESVTSNLRWFFYSLLWAHAFFYWLIRRRGVRFTPPSVLFFFFVFYAAVSTAYSIRPDITVLRAATLIMLWMMCFTYFVDIFKDKYEGEKVLLISLLLFFGSILGGLLLALFGKWSPFMFNNPLRFRGLSFNPNQFGMICYMALPSALYLATFRRNFSYRLALVLVLLFTVLSGSRSAIAGVGVTLFVFLLLTKRLGKYLPQFMLFLSISISLLFFSHSVQNVAEDIVVKSPGRETFLESFQISRLDLWKYGIKFFRKKPVFGHGHGTGPYTWGEYYSPEMSITVNVEENKGPYFENIYIEVLVTLGIVGFFLFLVFAYFVYALLINSFRSAQNEIEREFYAFFIAFFTGALIYSLFMSWLLSVGNYVSIVFWLTLSFGLAGSEKKRESPMG